MMFKLKDRLNMLKNTELFAHVPDEILALIHDKMKSFRLPAGTILFTEGEVGDTLYLIVEGELEVQSHGVEIATRGPGECVGELALLNDSTRNATIHAKTDTLMLQLNRSNFYQVLTTSWEVVSSMFQILGKRQTQDIKQQIIRLEKKVEERTNELHEKQVQLIHAEKMAALGSLVAGVVHELNNPISAMNSAADVSNRCIDKITEALDTDDLKKNRTLQQGLKLLKANLRLISTASERTATTIASLRNFARLDEAEFQKADLHEGLDSTLTLLEHELNNKVRVIKEYGNIPPIECYPSQLNQVFMNMLLNAIESITDKGIIRIRTFVNEHEIHLQIADTGVGIPSEHIDRIFNPGFTTKGVGVGTGLGLAISYTIIKEHNGNINVESRPGEGTLFTITLPIKGLEKRGFSHTD